MRQKIFLLLFFACMPAFAVKQLRILSIDGGGIRGMLPAVFMEKLYEQTGVHPADQFDLIVGTSVGGILALGYAMGEYTPHECTKIFEKHGHKIFSTSWRKRFSSVFGLRDEKYEVKGLETLMKQYFGKKTTLSDITRTEAMVVAYEAEAQRTELLRTWKARQSPSDDLNIWKAARATSAAPTYFEPAKITYEDGVDRILLDGGIVAKNPILYAYGEAREKFPKIFFKKKNGKLVPRKHVELTVVSLGTGDFAPHLPYSDIKDMGVTGWVRPLIEIAMSSKVEDDYIKTLISKEDYFRWNPVLAPEHRAMDDASASNIKFLRQCAEAAVEAYAPEMERLAARLAPDEEISSEEKHSPLSLGRSAINLSALQFKKLKEIVAKRIAKNNSLPRSPSNHTEKEDNFSASFGPMDSDSEIESLHAHKLSLRRPIRQSSRFKDVQEL